MPGTTRMRRPRWPHWQVAGQSFGRPLATVIATRASDWSQTGPPRGIVHHPAPAWRAEKIDVQYRFMAARGAVVARFSTSAVAMAVGSSRP